MCDGYIRCFRKYEWNILYFIKIYISIKICCVYNKSNITLPLTNLLNYLLYLAQINDYYTNSCGQQIKFISNTWIEQTFEICTGLYKENNLLTLSVVIYIIRPMAIMNRSIICPLSSTFLFLILLLFTLSLTHLSYLLIIWLSLIYTNHFHSLTHISFTLLSVSSNAIDKNK